MVKRVLMIAFHFPPLQGSSGIQRTLKFAQYLPQHGWQPIVLSASARAYAATDAGQLTEIDSAMPVERSFALDASRHLALRGRYPGVLALPDRWSSWWLGAVPAGLRLIRRYRPDVIWSTYPIATAHLIGWTLQRLSGLPWVADMRDPMTEGKGTDIDAWPPHGATRRIHQWIERRVERHGAALVCTTPGALAAYRQRFARMAPQRLCLIENGYDEASFASAAQRHPPPAPDGRFRLLHSGIIYPWERDPGPLFGALAMLRDDEAISADNFRLVLRASGHDAHLRQLLRHYAIEELVELAPPLPYHAALADMLAADGLLLLQADNCDRQIPAKLYEYLRAGRPLLALTGPHGDTAHKLRTCGIDTIAALDAPGPIASALLRFLALARAGNAPLAGRNIVATQSRQARSAELAALLEQVCHREPS